MGLKNSIVMISALLASTASLAAEQTPPPAAAEAVAQPAAVAAPANREDARLNRLFEADARRETMLDPLSALYRSEAVSAEAFGELFSDTLDRKQQASILQSLKALERIDRARLSPERQISYDAFQFDKRQQLNALRPDYRELIAVRPLTHFGGLQVEYPSLMAADGAMPYKTEADYRQALALHRAFVTALGNATADFRRGMANGVVESRLTVSNMIGQIDALLAQPVSQSPFYTPVTQFPDAIPPNVQTELRAEFTREIEGQLYPAYRRLRSFLADEYLPSARVQPGLSAMKGGNSLYRLLIEHHTTLKQDPEQVHQLGLGEVARIQREMDGVWQELGFTGTLPQFFEHIRTDPRYHPKTREQLAKGFADVGRQVDALIPQYFSRVPRTPLLIQPYPAYREKYEAGGSYNQGSPDGSRPGVFYFNTYDLPSRFLTGITTLYLHEGAPGHHFQISLAQEDTSLPKFQRFDGNNAFVEGWALYAETLGYEMGFYKDPMQHWGTLDDEMLRAMRLVVDTGIHAKGWTREQAIDYMLANSGMGRTDATSEVERYIAIPGQALSYKIGALTIQRLRRKAETELGAKFDIRAFHEQILGSGALPLPVLEAKIDRWIAASR